MKSKLVFDERKFISKIINRYLSSDISFLNLACGGRVIPNFIDKNQLKDVWGVDKNNELKKSKNIAVIGSM